MFQQQRGGIVDETRGWRPLPYGTADIAPNQSEPGCRLCRVQTERRECCKELFIKGKRALGIEAPRRQQNKGARMLDGHGAVVAPELA